MDIVTITNKDLEKAEKYMLSQTQVACPVLHHFGPGIYIREVFLPAGIIAIGHAQKYPQLNIVLKGKVAIIEGDTTKVIEAPTIFIGEAGRKAGYVIEDCAWLNVYATDETDIEKLEDMFFDKSETWMASQCPVSREEDIKDFDEMLKETGFDSVTVRTQSENKTDLIGMPAPYSAIVSVRDSAIEGKGLFLSYPCSAGETIAPARIRGMRTPAGRFVNHSKNPNCKFVRVKNGDIYLVSLRNISGCKGGEVGEELTVDYRQSVKLIKEEAQCQG